MKKFYSLLKISLLTSMIALNAQIEDEKNVTFRDNRVVDNSPVHFVHHKNRIYQVYNVKKGAFKVDILDRDGSRVLNTVDVTIDGKQLKYVREYAGRLLILAHNTNSRNYGGLIDFEALEGNSKIKVQMVNLNPKNTKREFFLYPTDHDEFAFNASNDRMAFVMINKRKSDFQLRNVVAVLLDENLNILAVKDMNFKMFSIQAGEGYLTENDDFYFTINDVSKSGNNLNVLSLKILCKVSFSNNKFEVLRWMPKYPTTNLIFYFNEDETELHVLGTQISPTDKSAGILKAVVNPENLEISKVTFFKFPESLTEAALNSNFGQDLLNFFQLNSVHRVKDGYYLVLVRDNVYLVRNDGVVVCHREGSGIIVLKMNLLNEIKWVDFVPYNLKSSKNMAEIRRPKVPFVLVDSQDNLHILYADEREQFELVRRKKSGIQNSRNEEKGLARIQFSPDGTANFYFMDKAKLNTVPIPKYSIRVDDGKQPNVMRYLVACKNKNGKNMTISTMDLTIP